MSQVASDYWVVFLFLKFSSLFLSGQPTIFLTGFFQSHFLNPTSTVGLPHYLKKIKTKHTIQSKTLLH